MRRPALPRLALIITSFPAIASAQEPPDSPDVDTALRAVVQKYVDAREARDPKASRIQGDFCTAALLPCSDLAAGGQSSTWPSARSRARRPS
jgi:hypothetical protein